MNKVGVIGCGAILPRHIEAIEDNDNFELIAVCDIDESALQYAIDMYDTKGYNNYKKMLSNNLDINLVVVATPNSLHFEQAKYCLKHKCDVLIEKPVCLNPKNVKLLSKIAKEINQKAYTVLQVRLNPTVKAIIKILSTNILDHLLIKP